MTKRDELVKKHMGLVHKNARNLYIPGCEYDDLVNQGIIGLLNAIDKFNPDKGVFCVYASWCIRNSILELNQKVPTCNIDSLPEALSEIGPDTLTHIITQPIWVCTYEYRCNKKEYRQRNLIVGDHQQALDYKQEKIAQLKKNKCGGIKVEIIKKNFLEIIDNI